MFIKYTTRYPPCECHPTTRARRRTPITPLNHLQAMRYPMRLVVDVASLSNQLLPLHPRRQVTLPYPFDKVFDMSIIANLVCLDPLVWPFPACLIICLHRPDAPAFLYLSVLLLIVQRPLPEERCDPGFFVGWVIVRIVFAGWELGVLEFGCAEL